MGTTTQTPEEKQFHEHLSRARIRHLDVRSTVNRLREPLDESEWLADRLALVASWNGIVGQLLSALGDLSWHRSPGMVTLALDEIAKHERRINKAVASLPLHLRVQF